MSKITIDRAVVEQALKLLDALSCDENYDYDGCFQHWTDYARPEKLALQFRAALDQTHAEPVAYEYVEYRPYGAPGEIRRAAILMEHYRLPDGTIAGDYEWLLQEFMRAKTTISLRPLYAGPYILEKVEQNV